MNYIILSEEPPWLFSQSGSPRSSAYATPRAPHCLILQTLRPTSRPSLAADTALSVLLNIVRSWLRSSRHLRQPQNETSAARRRFYLVAGVWTWAAMATCFGIWEPRAIEEATRTRPNRSDPRLGERAVGRVAEGGWNCPKQNLSQGHQAGADMGRLHDEKSIWHIVKDCAKRIGIPKLALMICGGRALVCAMLPETNLSRSSSSWGHVSVQTTERYLLCKQRIRPGRQ
jgi:hypothetical protein